MGNYTLTEMKVLMVFATLVVICLAHKTGRHHIHHQSHHHHREPIEFDLERADGDKHSQASLDELFQAQNQIQTSAGLSAAGPLTRADFGGEKPYEVESIDDQGRIESAQQNVQYQELSTPEDVINPVVNMETTVPKLMSDGRLVRVPLENTPKPAELVAPDASSKAPAPDVNLLEMGEGLSVTAKAKAPNPPFAAKKVRVASLVSGILSSTLSSVLTRGMEFTSARSS